MYATYVCCLLADVMHSFFSVPLLQEEGFLFAFDKY